MTVHAPMGGLIFVATWWASLALGHLAVRRLRRPRVAARPAPLRPAAVGLYARLWPEGRPLPPGAGHVAPLVAAERAPFA